AEGRVQLRGQLFRPRAPVGVVVAAADVVRGIGDRREGRLRDLAEGQVVVARVRETVAEENETVVPVLRPGGRGRQCQDEHQGSQVTGRGGHWRVLPWVDCWSKSVRACDRAPLFNVR